MIKESDKMKLNQLVTTSKTPDGVYVAVNLNKESCDKIKKLANDIGVDNVVARGKMHCTVIYSRKYVPDIEVDQSVYPMEANAKCLHIFRTFDNKNALVLKLDCPQLVERHNFIMDKYKTTYDFEEYIPHVTISYDCGDFNPEDFTGELPNIVFVGEYLEDLILDWQNKGNIKDE